MIPFESSANAHIASRASERTRTVYEADLARWVSFCKLEDIKLEAPSADAGPKFRDALQKILAPATVRRILAALSSIYGAAVAKNPPLATWNPVNPKALPWPPSAKFGKTQAVSAEIAEKMIAAAEADLSLDGTRDAAILRLLYETGLRRMSIVGLLRANVLADGIARVTVKGAEEAEVELPRTSFVAVMRWINCQEGLYVFPKRGDLKRSMDVGTINKIVRARAKEVGAEKVHPHQFRAAFVTSAINSGVYMPDIQASVHHKDARTTQMYDRGKRGFGVTGAVAKARRGENR